MLEICLMGFVYNNVVMIILIKGVIVMIFLMILGNILWVIILIMVGMSIIWNVFIVNFIVFIGISCLVRILVSKGVMKIVLMVEVVVMSIESVILFLEM